MTEWHLLLTHGKAQAEMVDFPRRWAVPSIIVAIVLRFERYHVHHVAHNGMQIIK